MKKKQPQKKIIQVESSWIDAYRFLTPEDLEALAAQMRTDRILSVGLDGYKDDEWDETRHIIVAETRLETDLEFNERIEFVQKLKADAAFRKQKDKERELKELARLKHKYPDAT
jgi:hypothetical protein